MSLSEHLARVDAADPASDDPVERINAQVAAQRQRHRERGDLDVDRYAEEGA